jgi:hypothetical protein
MIWVRPLRRICATIRAIRAGRRVDIRRPQLGRQEMTVAEYVQRQIAEVLVLNIGQTM